MRVTLGIMGGTPCLVLDVTDPHLNVDDEREKVVMGLGLGGFYGTRWVWERTGITVFRPVKDSE